MTSGKIILAVARLWNLRKFNVANAGETCLRLIKSLYGLKQAGRLWNQLLDQTLNDAVFSQSVTEACVYVKTTAEGTTVVRVYVDDLLATATSDELLDAFGAAIQILELKCLGSVKNFLGMRIGYDDLHGYNVDQE
uniref:Reverse transcriptase Ty1/copia-type domain-containing protein n=1 Tax=Peronospora matthiolae TaxID=2874970 RepID=A0AAV1UJ88_9STRA